MNAAVIIPVYNHGGQIGAVVRHAAQLGLPIWVIDDGSTDGTAAVLNAIEGIMVIRHPVNQGKGAALLTGFAAAHEHGCGWAIALDGDGQHHPEDARLLLAAAADSGRCLVIGARQGMEVNAHVPWTSRFGRLFSNFWVWIAGGPLIADSQSGFRLYPLPEVLCLGVQSRRYQFEVEILVRARQQGITIKETPVRVAYQAKGVRVSHFRPWLDFWRNAAVFSTLIWARIFRVLC